MNKCYKLIFSKRLGKVVVVSEAVSSQGKTAGIATVLALGLGVANGTAMAASITDVAAGTTVSGVVLGSGDTQRVRGVASATAVKQDGMQTIEAGGVTSATTLNGGVQIVSSGGVASATTVNSSGSITVSSGGVANRTVVESGGFMSVDIGAVGNATTLYSGAIQIVGGVERSATVKSGALQSVYGSAMSTVVSGGSQNVYGVSVDTTVDAGGLQHVYGGVYSSIANGTILLSGGSQTVGSGAIASATIVNSGGMQSLPDGAFAVGTTVNAGGLQRVSSGGVASATTVSSGGHQFVSGGVASATVVSGGLQTVVARGSAVSATVNAGGHQFVSRGVASATVVNSGGAQTVASGGSAIRATVNAGGQQTIEAGGVASATTVNSGGIITVSSGGSSYYTQVSSGGLEIIQAGGYGPSATIYAGGTQTIEAGGLDSGSTILAGGSQLVGGKAQAAIISGSQIIQAGGSGIDGLVQPGGSVTASSGSVLLGYKVVDGGASISAAGVVSASSVGGQALSVSGSANSVVLTGAQLGASVQYAGSGNTLSIADGATLTAAVALTDTTGSNTLTLSNQNLTLANSLTSGAAVVSGWNAFNIGSNASVDLAGNAINLSVGALSNAGTLIVGANQALTVNGNYSQTGSLAVGVTNPSTYGKVVVNGNTVLSNTARIDIRNGSVLAEGTTYSNIFRTNGTTTGAFVSRGTYGLMQYRVVQNGSGFDLVTDGSRAEMTPLFNGGQAMMNLNQAQASLQVIRDRMENMDGVPYHNTDSNNRIWITPFANTASQSGNGNPSAAYRQNTSGLAFGADTPLGEGLRMGIAASIVNTDVNGQNPTTKDSLAATSYQLTGYAKQRVGEASELRFIINGALDQSRASRLVTANGISENASARYGGWHGLLSAEANHSWQFGDTSLTPLVRLDYGYVRVNPYNESGTHDSNLNVKGQDARSLVAAAGGRLRYDINETSHVLVRALVGHDFAAKATTLTATDVNGISFTTAANSARPLVMQAGISYEIKPVNDRMSLRASYDYFGRSSGYRNSMINFNLIAWF